MNIRMLACGIIIGAAASTLITNLISQPVSAALQPDEAAGMPSPEEMQEMMAEWMATMQPGPHHEVLNQFIGKWDTTTSVWWGGPGTPASVTHGESESEWVLDGRYVRETSTSEFAIPDGAGGETLVPHAGLGLSGYDNIRNLYTGVWLDNMGTQMLTMKGNISPDGKTMTFYGEMDEPMLKVFGRTVKYVVEIESKDRTVFSIYDLHAGDDYKVIEVLYERKQ